MTNNNGKVCFDHAMTYAENNLYQYYFNQG